MNIVFEPSLLFISEIDWYDEVKRDAFLEHLDEQLSTIDEYEIGEILWTEAFDLLLYETPQMLPWRQEYWAVMQIIPNIYRKLNNKTNYSFDGYDTNCLMKPDFANTITIHDAIGHFLKLVHTLIDFEEFFYLCVGVHNQLPNLNQYTFYCNCHQNQLMPTLINAANDWFKYINILEKLFPKTVERFEDVFNKAIRVTRFCEFGDKPLMYTPEFELKFKQKVVSSTRNQAEILKNITKRLILLTPQAQADGSLQDKHYKGKDKKGLRRMRITQGTRVDYVLNEIDKIITFVMYYDEGDYDNSL
jgi:hypothetical protein